MLMQANACFKALMYKIKHTRFSMMNIFSVKMKFKAFEVAKGTLSGTRKNAQERTVYFNLNFTSGSSVLSIFTLKHSELLPFRG